MTIRAPLGAEVLAAPAGAGQGVDSMDSEH
jgi:hypothetical protein